MSFFVKDVKDVKGIKNVSKTRSGVMDDMPQCLRLMVRCYVGAKREAQSANRNAKKPKAQDQNPKPPRPKTQKPPRPKAQSPQGQKPKSPKTQSRKTQYLKHGFRSYCLICGFFILRLFDHFL
jgi:hypothetical protein